MVNQAPFKLEQFMNTYEDGAEYNLGETCCYSLSISEIEELTGNPFDISRLTDSRLAYMYIRGSPELRKLISEELYKKEITSDQVVITNGAIGANFLTFYSLIGPGDHVIVATPIYEQLVSVPEMFGADVETLELKYEDGFIPNLLELEKLVKPNTKLIVVNNPNNPTGQIIPNAILEGIVDIAKSVDCYVLCDEVYRPLFHSVGEDEEVPKSIVELYQKGISTSSMSKAFSLAGIRLGWVVSKDDKFIEDCLSRRDFNMISVSMVDDLIAQYGLINKDAILKRNYKLCRDNAKLLEKAVKDSNGSLEYVKPKSGTTVFVKVNGVKDTMKLAKEMMSEYKTLVVPGETFDYPGHLRIGFANSEKDLKYGLANLVEYLARK